MPYLLVTDLLFPTEENAARQRMNENVEKMQVHESSPYAVELGIKVFVQDKVDAATAAWRLFDSPADIGKNLNLTKKDIRLVLTEHLWPRQRMSDRDTFHKDLLISVASQWPDAFVVMVQRSGGLGDANSLFDTFKAWKERKSFIMSVKPHYTPLQQNKTALECVPIAGTHTDQAVIICPKNVSRFVRNHMIMKHIEQLRSLDIPSLCEYIFVQGSSVLQLGCFTCESPAAIMGHIASQYPLSLMDSQSSPGATSSADM